MTWTTVPLKFLATSAQTGPFGSQLHSAEYIPGGIPVINPSNIKDGRLVADNNVTVSNNTAARLATHRLIPGDLIFARRGQLGRSAVAPEAAAGWLCGTGSIRVRVDRRRFDTRFASYALQSSQAYDYFRKQSVGSTMDNLNTAIVLRLPIMLPPMEHQRRIADFLDAETARIDRLTTLRNTQIACIEERYMSAISEYTTPRISSNTPRSDRWPWLPENVEVARLGYFARVQSGVTVHSARTESPSDAEYPYLRVANVQDGAIDLAEVKSITIPSSMASQATLRDGDVVVTEANGNPDNLGRGAVWRNEIPGMIHQNHIFAIRATKGKLLPEYIAALFASVHGRRYFRFTSSQVGIATTSSSKVLDFPIPVAKMPEQKQIVHACESARHATNRAVKLLQRQRALLAERRQALITAAVTGQIDVSTASGRGIED